MNIISINVCMIYELYFFYNKLTMVFYICIIVDKVNKNFFYIFKKWNEMQTFFSKMYINKYLMSLFFLP
jgi:hypothetical protein